jgi:hypothetical protein
VTILSEIFGGCVKKEIIFIFWITLVLILQQVNALSTAGTVLPDSIFYGLDIFFDRVSLWLAPKEEKISKALEIAEERLAEVDVMLSKEHYDAMKKAQEEHKYVVDFVKETIKTTDVREIINSTQSTLSRHEEKIKQMILEKNKIENELSSRHKNMLNVILTDLETGTNEIQNEIKKIRQGIDANESLEENIFFEVRERKE